MRIRLAIPDRLVTPEILEAALEATTLANQAAIENGEVPPITDAIRKGGVQWREEPFIDGEHFDLAGIVSKRRWGDCDDLGPWLAGELRATGDDPGARTRILRTGKKRWHAVTELSDGQILDPSKWAGMGKRSARDALGVHGTVSRPMAHVGGGAIACIPGPRGQWYARCDVPFGDAHLASHARARSADMAVERAINGALVCGEGCESPLLDRMMGAGRFLLSGTDVALRDAHNITKTGWTFGDKRITTADANALQMYAAKGNSWLARYGDHGKPDLAAQNRIDQNRERIVNDIYFAAQILDTLSKHERTWIRDKYHPHGFLHDVKSVATGPLGWALNPAMALGYHTSRDKKFAGARALAQNAMMPGAGGLDPSMLTTLTRGAGGILQPPEGGDVVHDPRTGAVSVPLESPDTVPDHGQHMFLMYHPLGNPGPVVMRF